MPNNCPTGAIELPCVHIHFSSAQTLTAQQRQIGMHQEADQSMYLCCDARSSNVTKTYHYVPNKERDKGADGLQTHQQVKQL